MINIDRQFIEKVIFRQYKNAPRFTQDSPIYPDVWLTYFDLIGNLRHQRVDLILTPHRKSSAAELFKAVSEKLAAQSDTDDQNWKMASNGETVAVRLTFFELINTVLPLSDWYHPNRDEKKDRSDENFSWLSNLVGCFLFAEETGREISNLDASDPEILTELFTEFRAMFTRRFNAVPELPSDQLAILYSVSRNRPAGITIFQSVPATKADAGRRLFGIDASGISWAVPDTGVDARHPAFRKTDGSGQQFAEAFGPKEDLRSNHTRVVATYDFTKFRDLMANIHEQRNLGKAPAVSVELVTGNRQDQTLGLQRVGEYRAEIGDDLRNGRLLDWTIIAPLLRIPHNNTDYEPPLHPHGTHVAGIIGACDKAVPGVDTLIGMCPGISLYDIRVLNHNGGGDEFNILAALQFVRWMNSQKDDRVVHGANLSFSIVHEVASYACGQTPVCDACERLVDEGTVIVAAAGNLGQAMFTSPVGESQQGFRMVNITDPGNAESVITVGATHRNRPHAYGVSYFSSKGPTGDGRIKPDLVAPGEKITSTVPNEGSDLMDGTSMAAPHVSGAAALLLAKHRELIGRPRRVKEILCRTATDLGREKYFQGCGMVDVLRAIQSV